MRGSRTLRSASCKWLVLGASLLPVWGADSALLFRKTFGGSGDDRVSAVATDASGYVIVGGTTTSYDFPVTDGSRNRATQFGVSGDSGGAWAPFGNLPKGTPVSLAVSGGTWFAGGSAGIFKSTDGGATWSASVVVDGVSQVAADSLRDGTVYALQGGVLLKTIDGGETWAATTQPVITPRRVDSIAVDPFHAGHVFALSVGSGNFRSFDGGQSWTPYTTPAPRPADLCSAGLAPFAFDRATPGVVYMADHCSLFRSTDAGVSWSLMATTFQYTFGVMAATKEGVLYVSAEDGLYRSGDQGASWELLLAYGFAEGPRFLAVDPARPSVILTDVARSDDGGATWTPNALGRASSVAVFDPAQRGRVVAATAGAAMAFLAKLDSAGTILAATYVGGQGGAGIAGVATGADGRIYVTGGTVSRDLPVSANAWVATPRVQGANYFAASFDQELRPVYSTYLPEGLTFVTGIAVDADGRAAILGFGPIAKVAPLCQVTKLKSDGSGRVFESRFGGGNGDSCAGIAADSQGNSIVVGSTGGNGLALAGNGTATHLMGDRDLTVVKLDADGRLVYAGYLGGSKRDTATAVAVDGAGNIYVTGNTASADFPVTSGAYQGALRSKCSYPSSVVVTGLIGTLIYSDTDDGFVTKLDPTGNLIYSTYVGGGCYDVPRSIAVDAQGNAWIAGATNSDLFPQVAPFEAGPQYSYYKAFVSELDPGGGILKLSSYLTSGDTPLVAVDGFGDAYVGGSTTPVHVPDSGPPAPPPTLTGVHASLAKVQPQFPGAVTIGAVGNAFSLRSGPVSAGQITRIAAEGVTPGNPVDLTLMPAGELPRTLAGAQVLFDGEAAALVSVSPGSVVAIAPYDLAGKKQTKVQVVFEGAISAPVLADVTADIAYLSADGSGAGQAYARNPDGSLNGVENPAPRGSLVTVYATGIGTAAAGCPEGGVARESTAGTGFQPVSGAVCGLFQTTVKASDFTTNAMSIGNAPVTIAVK